MGIYTVQQGDHLSSIAHSAGLHSFKVLWHDGENSHLKDLRKNPNVLFPGDKIEVREARPKSFAAATEKHHRFKRRASTLRLRLRLLSDPDRPAKDTTCRLVVGSRDESLPVDGEGIVDTPIAPDARDGHLVVTNHRWRMNAALGIGELDPIDTVSGQIGRLNNLGYFAGPPAEPAEDIAKIRFRSAVEEFQCDHGLKVDGVLGPGTRAALEKVHGC